MLARLQDYSPRLCSRMKGWGFPFPNTDLRFIAMARQSMRAKSCRLQSALDRWVSVRLSRSGTR